VTAAIESASVTHRRAR